MIVGVGWMTEGDRMRRKKAAKIIQLLDYRPHAEFQTVGKAAGEVIDKLEEKRAVRFGTSHHCTLGASRKGNNPAG